MIKLSLLAACLLGPLCLLAADASAEDGEAQLKPLEMCEGQVAKAEDRLAACQAALEEEASAAAARRSRILTAQAAAQAEAGDKQGAVAALSEAIALLPTNASALEARGDLLRENAQCDVALADYHQAIRVAPEKVSLYISRSDCLIRERELDGAITDLDQVIALDAKNEGGFAAVALASKAQLLTFLNKIDAALEQYDLLIALVPDNAMNFIERGTLFAKKNDLDAAFADYGKALDVDKSGPAATLAYIARGNLLGEKGELAQAEKEFESAISADEAGVTGLTAYGQFLLRNSKYAEAAARFEKVLEAAPGDLSAHANRALAFYYLGDYQKAAADMKAAADPTGALYPHLLLYALAARSGDKEAANALSKQLAAIKSTDWPHPLAEFLLGKRAQPVLEAQASKPSERCEAQFYIGQFNIIRNNKVGAEKALKSAVEICPKESVEGRGAMEDLKRLK